MPSQTRIQHQPGLDGLRGLAVLAVVAYHFDLMPGGYLGVDFFFVLSGFLITSLLIGEFLGSATVSLSQFWSRRAARLLPALFVVVAACCLYAAFLAEPSELGALRRDGLSGIFYVANWAQISAKATYFDQFTAPSPLRHLWSLSIEEQFYLVWPLIVWALLRLRRPLRAIAIVSGAGAVASFSWAMLLFDPSKPTERLYFGTDTRAGAVLVGAFAACVMVKRGDGIVAQPHEVVEDLGRTDRPRWGSTAAAGVVLCGLLVAWTTLDGTDSLLWRGALAACGIGSAVVVSIVASRNAGPISTILSNPLLVWFGLVSYGLYLWHWPVKVVLSEQRTGISGAALVVLWGIVSVALSAASFYLLERPIRSGWLRKRVRVDWMRVALPIGAAGLVALGVGASTREASGGATDVSADFPVLIDTPSGDGEPLLPAGTTPRVLVMGDSVGFTIGKGMEALGAASGFDASNSAVEGCALVLEAGQYLFDGAWYPDPPGCTKVLDVFDDAVNKFHPNLVIFSYGRFWDPQRKFASGQTLSPCDAAYDSWRQDTWRRILEHAKASGIAVAVTTASYYRGKLPTEGADAQTDCMNTATIAAAKEVGVRVLRLDEWQCPKGACRMKIAGRPFRVDGLHYDDVVAPYVAEWILNSALDGWKPQQHTTDPGD